MGWREDKQHPDRRPTPSPHEIDASARAADTDDVEDVFVNPQDGLDRVDELGIEGAADVEKRTPDFVDELDHAGLEDSPPMDHPGDATEEPSKGVQARWGKSGP